MRLGLASAFRANFRTRQQTPANPL